jgi:hypothetical protein
MKPYHYQVHTIYIVLCSLLLLFSDIVWCSISVTAENILRCRASWRTIPIWKKCIHPRTSPIPSGRNCIYLYFENLRFNQQSLEVSTLTIIVMNGIRWTCTMYACTPYLVLFIFTFLDFNGTLISTVQYQFWQHLQLHIRHPPNASNLMIKVPRLLLFTIQPYLSFF